MCLLYLVMTAAIMVCLQLYIPRFQHLQNLFIKIIKMHITVTKSRQSAIHFQNRLDYSFTSTVCRSGTRNKLVMSTLTLSADRLAS